MAQSGEMGGDHVLDVDPAVEELVDLDIGVDVGVTYFGIVVGLGEEAGGPQDDAGQPVIEMEGWPSSSAAILVAP